MSLSLYLSSFLFFIFIFMASKATFDKKQGIVDRRVKMLLSKQLPDSEQTDISEADEEKEDHSV